MTKQTFGTLLMISWICVFASPVTCGLSAFATVVITIILVLNVAKLYDAEQAKKLTMPLGIQCGTLALGIILSLIALLLSLTGIGVIIGLPLYILVLFMILGVGVWQLILWLKIKNGDSP